MQNKSKTHSQGFLTGAILALAFLILALPGFQNRAASQTMIEPHAQAMPLLPFLDCLVDPSLGMDIVEAAQSNGWQPLLPDRLPLEEGIVWLRFTIAPLAPDARPRTFLLDLGESVPGTATLFDPVRNELSGAQEWRENLPSDRNILLLPEATTTAIPCYIRLEGFPGPWFAPMIRTPQDAASNWSSLAKAAAILALGVVMALCLLRGLTDRGQWRYWIGLFTGAALLQAWLGMPALTGRFSLLELATVLLPGIALMILPHAGRHLMQARTYSKSLDIQLFLLSLPGAALAVLPLIPGWDWLYRWLDLWPLGTLIFIPTALAAWLAAIPGARRFLIACCIPPLFTGLAWFGLDFGLPANILASGPAWGVFLACLILVSTLPPYARPKEAAKPAKQPEPEKKKQMPEIKSGREEIINLGHPLDDPNLRILPPDPDQKASQEPPPRYVPVPLVAGSELEQREIALREPLDELLRESANLERCALPPSARRNVENVITSAHRLASILSNLPVPGTVESPKKAGESFNLQHILRKAHDTVAPSAEYSGIALSWYMPPHMPQIYEGDAELLEATLSMLLESAVRSAHHGAIKISAKRVPDSPDPGHLLFTVMDNGSGYPPLERSSLALARAWELTGQYGGYLSLESSQHGATIAFTAHFRPVSEEEESGKAGRVMLIGDEPEKMRSLSRIIETLPCAMTEATSTREAISLQTQQPADLLITCGSFSHPASADMVRELMRIARAKDKSCSILAITGNEKEWGLLKASGFTHAMLEPVDPEILRRTVSELTGSPEAQESAGQGDLFYEQSSALNEVRPVKTDQAPSMLIEQNFPIAPTFEGPDWLGHQEESESKPEAIQRPEHPEAPESAAEWVGEPKPVVKATAAKPQAEKPQGKAAEPDTEKSAQAKKAAPEKAPVDAIEWVGEPTPIPSPKKSGPDEEGELLDFIVDVKETGSRDAQPDQGKDSPVKSFMESSVNLVASALTGMLRQESREQAKAPEQKPAETSQARSDPALVALLERMDEAMKTANGAFKANNCQTIAEATDTIAKDAETFGLRLLARMAKCVERAASAKDMTALADLLPELGIAIERNRITLAQRKQQ